MCRPAACRGGSTRAKLLGLICSGTERMLYLPIHTADARAAGLRNELRHRLPRRGGLSRATNLNLQRNYGRSQERTRRSQRRRAIPSAAVP